MTDWIYVVLGAFFGLIVIVLKEIWGAVRFVGEEVYGHYLAELFEFALLESWEDNLFEKLAALLGCLVVIFAHLVVLRLVWRALSD